EVKFYLPHEFAKSKPIVKVGKGGKATVRRLSLRPFTAGALADRGATRLELDLAELTDAPPGFTRKPGFFREQPPADSGFKYACFLSYSARSEFVRDFVNRFHRALSNELELLTERPIFFDRDSLVGTEVFEREMAAALVRSACYIIFCTPTFFTESWTRRELEAMRILVERRRGFFTQSKSPGMILPVVLRGGPTDLGLPPFLQTIQYLDLSHVMSGPNWFRSKAGQQRIRNIAEFVFENCKEAERAPEAFADWENFVLPPESF